MRTQRDSEGSTEAVETVTWLSVDWGRLLHSLDKVFFSGRLGIGQQCGSLRRLGR